MALDLKELEQKIDAALDKETAETLKAFLKNKRSLPSEYKKEELFKLPKTNHNLTVGRLKKYIEGNNLPDHAPVLIERVEDTYYEDHNWSVYLKDNQHSYSIREDNKLIESGEYFNEDNFPDLKPENIKITSDEELKEYMNQYHPAWCCAGYQDDKDILFINLHY